MCCVLGFDGGATKTECVLLNEAGNVLASGRSGASNPGLVGFERAIEEIKKAAQAVMIDARVKPESISALCAGIAGVGAAKAAERMRDEHVGRSEAGGDDGTSADGSSHGFSSQIIV